MYEVNAEKKPVSVDLAALSTICDGDWRGIGGMGRSEMAGAENCGMSELTNRLSQMRIIWIFVSIFRTLISGCHSYMFPAVPDYGFVVGDHTEKD